MVAAPLHLRLQNGRSRDESDNLTEQEAEPARYSLIY